MFKPGTVLNVSGTVRRWSCSMSAAVMTVTELATLVADVGIAVGLYTIVALAAGAATAVGTVVRAGMVEGSLSGADGRGCRCRQRAIPALNSNVRRRSAATK
jgi:hypothetical protein